MLVEKVIPCNFVGDHLGESRGVQVCALLQLNEFCNDIWRRNDPAKTQTWRKGLRKGAEVNHVADGVAVVAAEILAVEDYKRREMLAFVAELAVRIVFDNRNSVFIG